MLSSCLRAARAGVVSAGAIALMLLAGCATSVDGAAQADQAVSEGCQVVTFCLEDSAPELGPKRPWRRDSSATYAASFDHHRGRDLLVVAGGEQWVIGKFAYGIADKDLKGEEVDIFVERGCGGHWEQLGTAVTTRDGEHPTTEGIEDSGGRIYFRIPKDKELPLGRHRVRMVVAGDHSFTDAFLEIVAAGTPVFVSDVDGTLTSDEYVEFRKLLEGRQPSAQANAAELFWALARKGYRPVYLTARPEWLTRRTHEFLIRRGFPPGVVQTTTGLTGARGEEATKFKADALARMIDKGVDIQWVFGNRESDGLAYVAGRVAEHAKRIFLRIFDPHGGRRIDGYAELLPDVAAERAYCE